MRSLLFVLIMPFTVTACADAPTLPGADTRETGPNFGTVTPIGGEEPCDPWLDLNWCVDPGDGECITSTGNETTTQGCGETGGGSPGGSSEPVPADTACNTSDDGVLNDPQVQVGLEDLWKQSRFDSAQSQRLESAAWIVQNSDGSRQLAPFTYTQRDPCNANGNWLAPAVSTTPLPPKRTMARALTVDPPPSVSPSPDTATPCMRSRSIAIGVSDRACANQAVAASGHAGGWCVSNAHSIAAAATASAR